MEKGGCTYIITNKKRTVFYTGVTSDLVSRIIQHREKHFPNSFSARYNLSVLVYYETHSTIVEAIAREKYIKGKSRNWKIELIKSVNPEMKDLWGEIEDW